MNRIYNIDSTQYNPYRFGFQGQENENDLYGTGNASTFKYRISDNRIGRFFSRDPLFKNYAWNSPYVFCENRVIDGVEMEGLEFYFFGSAKWASYVGNTSINKSWEGKVSNDIYEINDMMKDLKKLPKEKQPRVIYIQHHSNQNIITLAVGDKGSKGVVENLIAGPVFQLGEASITPQDINSYLNKEPLSESKYDAINALSNVLNSLPKLGIAIMGGCLAGSGEFPEAISKLAPDRLIIMNKDIQVNFQMDKPLNPQSEYNEEIDGQVGFDEGFVGAINGKKIDLSGTLGPINIQLNSEGTPPIKPVIYE